MQNLRVEIELLSETIFGNGQVSDVSINVDVVKDNYGIPYFKGKTFKGKLREEIEAIADILNKKGIVDDLLGKEGSEDKKLLRFSDCKLSENILNNLAYAIDNYEITKDELTAALTDIRTFTRLNEEGIAEDGSLRKARVIKKGLKFYCDITALRDLTVEEKGLLACGISAIRNLGTMESRGKGQVKCRLFEDDVDITSKYIEELEKEVR